LQVAPIDTDGTVGIYSPLDDTVEAPIGSFWLVKGPSGCVAIFRITGSGQVSLSDVVK
jgi:hypothetical protein